MLRVTIQKVENGYVLYEDRGYGEPITYVFATLKAALAKAKAILEPKDEAPASE